MDDEDDLKKKSHKRIKSITDNLQLMNKPLLKKEIKKMMKNPLIEIKSLQFKTFQKSAI